MRSRHDAPRGFRTHDDFLPYLSARNSIHGGYKPCSWGDEDRTLGVLVKSVMVMTLSGFLCLFLAVVYG